ncbi:MAG TPA: preprotein translocase subunit YajC [Phycisphaerales bacterium]|nr:preprotein translocase subunit YajC [Phycisphaerales bacterium]
MTATHLTLLLLPSAGLALAQAGGAADTAPAQPLVPGAGTPPASAPATAPGPGMGTLLFPMLVVVGFMLVMSVVTQRKERRRRQALMSSLKKGEKVQTIAGIIGTIAELRDDEVVLRVDEVSNTRIRFARSAIASVVRASAEPAAEAQARSEPARV